MLRYWWLLVIGLVAAQLAAVFFAYSVDFSSVPPKLEEREKPTYTALARLFVTSTESPYLRIGITRDLELPAATSEDPNATTSRTVLEEPNTRTLINAANLYPLLIESDMVTAVREKMFGRLPGVVRARALFSVSTPQRFEPSTVPVIELAAQGNSVKQAITLVQATSDAFRSWVVSEQKKAKVPPKQRILIQQLQTPRAATPFGGTSLALPVLVFVAIFCAFAVLAIVLDRVFPRPAEPQSARVETFRAAAGRER
jgi:hypothetical protein